MFNFDDNKGKKKRKKTKPGLERTLQPACCVATACGAFGNWLVA